MEGDRAARASADAAFEAALAELEAAHASQLEAAGFGGGAEAAAKAVGEMSVSGGGGGGGGGGGKGKGKSKAAQKREKKEQEERDREKRIADYKAGAGPSERDVELDKFAKQLGPLGLKIQPIEADGHCLYRSLAHQLAFAAGEPGADFVSCRRECAQYMRTQPSLFLPYLAADGVELGPYTAQVESSSEWGGQLEITAFSHARRRAVAVFSADAPMLLTGSEYEAAGPPLQLAYHRHYYGLGEHYNSTAAAAR